jgi:hypothetical protein
MVTDEILRTTKAQESGIPKIMVYTDGTVKWKLNENTSEKKFQSTVTVCKYLGLNVWL